MACSTFAYDGAILSSLKDNFLVRERFDFARSGLAIAVVDAPGGQPLDGISRSSPEYTNAISLAITDLHSRTHAGKIWLVGTSTGTIGVAAVAAHLPRVVTFPPSSAVKANASRPDGLVLTSTQTVKVSGQCGVTVFENNNAFNLSSVNVPSYDVAHRLDACPCYPAKEASHVLSALTHAPQKASKIWTGGTSQGNVCQAFAYHGYNGIELSVVGDIVKWVRTH